MEHKFRFSVSHAESSGFKDDGLRPFFQYRDLGIRDSTNGAVVAHVIRAKPGTHVVPERHHHQVDFQMVYVLKGWVKFDYEGVGEVTLKAGSCVHQSPGIKHIEIDHSDDLELIEIVMPADFRTVKD
jgi:quercetin dioxygenase-like cupin family protein